MRRFTEPRRRSCPLPRSWSWRRLWRDVDFPGEVGKLNTADDVSLCCVYIYIYINTYVFIYIYIYVYIYIHIHMYTYIYIHMCIYIYIHMCVYIYYICVYIYIYYICATFFVYIYIYIAITYTSVWRYIWIDMHEWWMRMCFVMGKMTMYD